MPLPELITYSNDIVILKKVSHLTLIKRIYFVIYACFRMKGGIRRYVLRPDGDVHVHAGSLNKSGRPSDGGTVVDRSGARRRPALAARFSPASRSRVELCPWIELPDT